MSTTLKWHRYTVALLIEDRLVGGIPIVPEGTDRADAYEGWARGQDVTPASATELATKLAEDPDMPVTEEDVEGLETGFRRDDGGIYIEARQVKAMLRESAQRLGIIKQVRGSRQVLQHDLHVRALDGTQKIRLERDGIPLMEPDGKERRPISVVTRQGPRTAIKRFEYVTGPEIRFEVRLLADGVGEGLLEEEQLAQMLEFGGMLGLGADRSQGEGCFAVESLEQGADE